ncbi:hypothetical protein PENTCL1PPCAC_7851, partial [Pristionchus entomophagus]
YQLQALHWIAEELFWLIRVERDPGVLIWLLRLVAEMSGPLTWNFEIYRDSTSYEVAWDVLTQKPCIRVRCQILKMVWNQLNHARVGQASNRLARVCCALIADFRARNCRLAAEPLEGGYSYCDAGLWDEGEVHLALTVLHHFLDEVQADVISEMCRNEAVMGVVFEAIRCEALAGKKDDGREESEPTNFLACLLRYTRK